MSKRSSNRGRQRFSVRRRTPHRRAEYLGHPTVISDYCWNPEEKSLSNWQPKPFVGRRHHHGQRSRDKALVVGVRHKPRELDNVFDTQTFRYHAKFVGIITPSTEHHQTRRVPALAAHTSERLHCKLRSFVVVMAEGNQVVTMLLTLQLRPGARMVPAILD